MGRKKGIFGEQPKRKPYVLTQEVVETIQKYISDSTNKITKESNDWFYK